MCRLHLHSASLALPERERVRVMRIPTAGRALYSRSPHFALLRRYFQAALSTAYQRHRSGTRAVGIQLVRSISVGRGSRPARLSSSAALGAVYALGLSEGRGCSVG